MDDQQDFHLPRDRQHSVGGRDEIDPSQHLHRRDETSDSTLLPPLAVPPLDRLKGAAAAGAHRAQVLQALHQTPGYDPGQPDAEPLRFFSRHMKGRPEHEGRDAHPISHRIEPGAKARPLILEDARAPRRTQSMMRMAM